MAAFDLSIESMNNRRYRVTVIDSPAGTASTEINPPFTFDELAELSDTLGGRAGLSPADLEKYQKQFGETLFNAVFTDAVRYAYTASQKATGSAALNIRLRLDKAGDLAALPWQWLSDPEGEPITVARLDKPLIFAPVGGLREALRNEPQNIVWVFLYALRNPLVLASIGILVAGIIIAGKFLIPPPDVDLTVTSIRFLPPRPAPGQIFKITMTITNQGTTRSGPFVWAWFRGDSRGASPDLTGRENGLGGGDTITVRGEYSFGWWDQYDSTGEVDRLRESGDKNIDNNSTAQGFALIQTNNSDFVLDFTVKPPADLITSPLDLKSQTEFRLWSLIKAQADTNGAGAECATAILKIVIVNNENFVRSGLPNSNATTCDGLPMLFTFDQPLGGAQVDFVATEPGKYTLTLVDKDGNTLLDKNNKPITVSKTLASAGTGSISLPASGVLKRADGAVTIRFEGLSGVRLQKLTLKQPASE